MRENEAAAAAQSKYHKGRRRCIWLTHAYILTLIYAEGINKFLVLLHKIVTAVSLSLRVKIPNHDSHLDEIKTKDLKTKNEEDSNALHEPHK